MSARVGLAVNPLSGSGRGASAGALAHTVLAAAGLEVVDLGADSGPALRRRVDQAVAEGLDALAVVGGDGMVNLGVNVAVPHGLPLGIVAAGTGNDIARGLALPVGDPGAAAAVVAAALASGAERRVDAVRCTPGADGQAHSWFAGVLGAGFDALVNERANRWSWPRGAARYDLAIARELPFFRPRRYRMDFDGERWETAAMLVAVANGPSYGGGMRVCPDARFDDGLLDVLVLEPVSRLAFVRLFPRVYAGEHVGHPKVTIRRARSVRVDAEGIVGYADGERLAALPLHCEVVPGVLRLLRATPGARAAAAGDGGPGTAGWVA